MKNISGFTKQALLIPALFAGMVVMAQRGDRNGNGRGGGGFGGGGGAMHENRGGGNGGGFNPGRGNDAPRNVDAAPRGNGGGYNPGNGGGGYTPRDNSVPRSNDAGPRTDNQAGPQRPQRYFDDQPGRGNNGNSNPGRDYANRPQPDQRDRSDRGGYNDRNYYRNNYGYNDRNRYNDRYRYDNRYYNNRGYYGRPYASPFRYTYAYPYWGQRYTTLNFTYRVIPFGGIGYCYYNGIFYRPFGSYYQVVAPPIGININVLPFGYSRIFVGAIPYYYYGGIYYRQYSSYYEVVDPPLGAKLPALPTGAREVIINGDRYFEDNGTFYMEEYNIDNQRLYTVVGVHGRLDDRTVDQVLRGSASYNNSSSNDTVYNSAPAARDQVIYTTLPDNCTKVVINGHEYFRSPTDEYYEAISDGSTTGYRIVGGNQ